MIPALRRSIVSLYSRRLPRWIVLSATLAAMAAALTGNQLEPPRYQSRAVVAVDPAAAGRIDLNSGELHRLFADRLKNRHPDRPAGSVESELEAGLRIEPVEGTGSLAVYFTTADPDKAADWLNAYLDLAVAEEADRLELAVKPDREILRARLDDIKQLLDDEQKQIHAYLSSDSARAGNDLEELERAYEDAEAKRTEEQRRLALLEPYLGADADLGRIPGFDFAPELRASAEKVAEIESVLGKLWLEGRNEDDLKDLADEMDLPKWRDSLRAELAKTAERLRTNIAALEADEQQAYERYSSESAGRRTRPGRIQDAASLQETSRNLSKMASALQEKLRLLDTRDKSGIWVAERASPDAHPISRSSLPFVLAAGLAGLVLSCAALLAGGMRRGADGGDGEVAEAALVPRLAREPYDALRALLRRNGERCRTVMITSSLPKEGKTTVAMNLARSLAATGDRTVFLDFDLRKRGKPASSGSERRNLNRVFSPVSGLNLRMETTDCPTLHRIVPVEPPQCLPFILTQPEIGELIRYLRGRYEWVIVDTPPVTSAKDPILVSSLVDAVLFVVKHTFVDKRIVKSSMAALERADAKLLGTVVNEFDPSIRGTSTSGYIEDGAGREPGPERFRLAG